jgi:hypothetical protein
MEKLVSMKLDKKEAEEKNTACCPVGESSKPKYPYGTELSFENEQVKKLGGLKEAEVDGTGTIKGKFIVTNISSNQQQGKEDRHSVRIQITDLALSFDNEFEDSFDEASKK